MEDDHGQQRDKLHGIRRGRARAGASGGRGGRRSIENEYLRARAADVVDACRALFGPDCQLQPKTPAEETFFEYDSVQNEFHVALYSSDSSYTPYTESERRSGGKVYLRVGYVSPSDEWRNQTSSTLEGPTPTKYMEYELTQDPSPQEYYISAIRSLEEEQ